MIVTINTGSSPLPPNPALPKSKQHPIHWFKIVIAQGSEESKLIIRLNEGTKKENHVRFGRRRDGETPAPLFPCHWTKIHVFSVLQHTIGQAGKLHQTWREISLATSSPAYQMHSGMMYGTEQVCLTCFEVGYVSTCVRKAPEHCHNLGAVVVGDSEGD